MTSHTKTTDADLKLLDLRKKFGEEKRAHGETILQLLTSQAQAQTAEAEAAKAQELVAETTLKLDQAREEIKGLRDQAQIAQDAQIRTTIQEAQELQASQAKVKDLEALLKVSEQSLVEAHEEIRSLKAEAHELEEGRVLVSTVVSEMARIATRAKEELWDSRDQAKAQESQAQELQEAQAKITDLEAQMDRMRVIEEAQAQELQKAQAKINELEAQMAQTGDQERDQTLEAEECPIYRAQVQREAQEAQAQEAHEFQAIVLQAAQAERERLEAHRDLMKAQELGDTEAIAQALQAAYDWGVESLRARSAVEDQEETRIMWAELEAAQELQDAQARAQAFREAQTREPHVCRASVQESHAQGAHQCQAHRAQIQDDQAQRARVVPIQRVPAPVQRTHKCQAHRAQSQESQTHEAQTHRERFVAAQRALLKAQELGDSEAVVQALNAALEISKAQESQAQEAPGCPNHGAQPQESLNPELQEAEAKAQEIHAAPESQTQEVESQRAQAPAPEPQALGSQAPEAQAPESQVQELQAPQEAQTPLASFAQFATQLKNDVLFLWSQATQAPPIKIHQPQDPQPDVYTLTRESNFQLFCIRQNHQKFYLQQYHTGTFHYLSKTILKQNAEITFASGPIPTIRMFNVAVSSGDNNFMEIGWLGPGSTSLMIDETVWKWITKRRPSTVNENGEEEYQLCIRCKMNVDSTLGFGF